MSDAVDGEPFVDDDGQYVGTWRALSNSDGSHGGWAIQDTASDRLLAAVDEYGEPVDPATVGGHEGSAAEYDDAADFYDEPEDQYEDQYESSDLDALRQQLAELEQRVDQPRRESLADAQARWDALVGRGVQEVQQQIGRELTDRELDHVRRDTWADFSAGVEPSVWKSLPDHMPDRTTHDGRVSLAMERLEDGERRDRGEAYSATPSPTRDAFNFDDKSERDEFYANVLDGVPREELAPLTYRASQLEEPQYEDGYE